MRLSDDTTRINLKGLEGLKISELLLAEASAKRRRGEIIEAMELRAEALARRRAALALLEEVTTTTSPTQPQRFSPITD